MLVDVGADALFSLNGKTAVITGAAGFLGKTLTQTLLENGARVVAISRSKKLHDLHKEFVGRYGENSFSVYQVDMYNKTKLAQVLKKISQKELKIDVLINNAHEMGPRTGFNTPEGQFERAGFDQWMKNLTGGIYWAALTTQILGIKMKKQRKGSIINVSSMYALVAPNPQLYSGTSFINPPGYSSAKAGLLALTRYVASFWGPYGIRANAILPGPFSNTENKTSNSVSKGNPFLNKLRKRTALGRVGNPVELAGALLYLASDASSYVTGQSLVVDGGWTIT